MVMITEKQKEILSSIYWEVNCRGRYRKPINEFDSIWKENGIYTFNEDPIDIGNLIKGEYLIYAGQFGNKTRYIIDEWKYYQEFIETQQEELWNNETN